MSDKRLRKESGGAAKESGEAMEDTACAAWGGREFGNACLGDTRRVLRLILLAYGLARNVDMAISNACGLNGAQLVSRFFDRKEVTVESILKSHFDETVRRCDKYDLIYAVQDTTDLNYGGHKALKGLGTLSSSEKEQGLMMHSVLAVSPDGTPLGFLDANLWARDPEEFGKGRNCRNRPIEEKESFKWIRGLERTEEVLPEKQRNVVMGDRESDIFQLFCHDRRPDTDILVRSCYDRSIENDEDEKERLHIQEALNRAKSLGMFEVEVPRQAKRKPRTAKMVLKSARVKIKRPSYLSAKKYPDFVEIWCVKIQEIDAPADVKEPLEWTLLTTLEADGYKEAVKVASIYPKRWIIEDFHKTLKKGGCNVERLQFENMDRLRPAIALLIVVAWRVLYLGCQGNRRI